MYNHHNNNNNNNNKTDRTHPTCARSYWVWLHLDTAWLASVLLVPSKDRLAVPGEMDTFPEVLTLGKAFLPHFSPPLSGSQEQGLVEQQRESYVSSLLHCAVRMRACSLFSLSLSRLKLSMSRNVTDAVDQKVQNALS